MINSKSIRPFFVQALGAKGMSGAHLGGKNTASTLVDKGLSGAHLVEFKMPQGGSLAKGYPSRFFGAVCMAHETGHFIRKQPQKRHSQSIEMTASV